MQLRMARDAYLPNAQTTRPICIEFAALRANITLSLSEMCTPLAVFLGDRVHRDKLALFRRMQVKQLLLYIKVYRRYHC